MHARSHRVTAFARRIFLFLLFAGLVAARAEVRVWQGTLALPTYEEGPPDPNPPFDQFATDRFNYPYTLRNNLTGRRAEHKWRAIYLENEYLKCSVLPDIGGHLYTCVDKINGQPIFYANPSIKKAEIGYRGAWAAFGVEFNFPVSHNWVSMSPVDFAFAKHDDGSASVTVGNIDRVYGMQWTVELVLRPQSTVLEQRVTLYNRSDVRHRFYWWSNAGVEVWDDSRIQYPMRFAASHGFTEVQPWPVEADGTDLSLIRNQTKGPVSLFVHGSREPFMGLWNPHTNSGTAHFASYDELPAKKIWSWGVDADGLDWRKTLSDNDSAYAEVQAGLFRNQETYAFLQPRQSISFSEYWMPVREIGGISRANLNGIVHLSRKGNALLIGLNVNHAVKHASLRILDAKQQILQENVDLSPERVWSHQLVLANPQDKYTFELQDDHGVVLLHQTEGEYDWTPEAEIHVGPQTAYVMPPAEKRSEDDWIQLGNQQELDGELLPALATYQQALAKYPDSFGLQKAAGRLCAGLLRSAEAKKYLEAVHARDTSDAEVSYYLGIAYEAIGETRAARGAFEAAHLMPEFKAAGELRLGELSARAGDLSQAESYLQRALESAPNDLRTAEELSAVRRALAKPAARDFVQEWLARFPQSYFLQEQLSSPDLSHLADDADRVLNVAAFYMRLGMYQPALDALSRTYPAAVPDETEPGSLPPQLHPLVAYFRAYCMEKLGQPASAAYQAAGKLSTAYVFPEQRAGTRCPASCASGKSRGRHCPLSSGHALFFPRPDRRCAGGVERGAQVRSRPAGVACQPGAGPVAGEERSRTGARGISRGAAQRSQQCCTLRWHRPDPQPAEKARARARGCPAALSRPREHADAADLRADSESGGSGRLRCRDCPVPQPFLRPGGGRDQRSPGLDRSSVAARAGAGAWWALQRSLIGGGTSGV